MRIAVILTSLACAAACTDDPPDCAPTGGGPFAVVEGDPLVPTHAILGEEEGDLGGDGDVEWSVGPIDGTVN